MTQTSNDAQRGIDRREALRRAALVLGGALSTSTIAGVLAGCEERRTPDGAWTPRALTVDQLDLVATIAEHILPETDSPGARAVGSGITGGWAAKELCEKGLRTLVLERGRHVEHGKDYVTEWWQPWQFAHRGRGEERLYERDYPIQSKNYAFGEATRHFFVNDREHPYVTPDDKPFRWIRGYQLGGRSLIWGRACWRWSDLDFTANLRDGHG